MTKQSEIELYCEWGLDGLSALAPFCQALVIVDVLSFCTCVDIAAARGAFILPFGGNAELILAETGKVQTAQDYAQERGALLAGSRRSETAFSLSPASLTALPAGARLVLPSPNGAALSWAAARANGQALILAGCLRNARSVADAIVETVKYSKSQGAFPDSSSPSRIGIIPAGERWPTGSLRPALEDLLGAGAILNALPGRRTPEADLAEATFLHFHPRLAETLLACHSGQELMERGFREDVTLASGLDVSGSVPILRDGMYYNGARGTAGTGKDQE